MMTFLNPGFLWLLPLLAIPIIIHLLAKRKSKLIEFPSLKFLKLMEQDALKKFNLKQLLLLILRTFLVLLVILSFSRPNLNIGSGMGIRLSASSLALIVLDNTASSRDHYAELTGPWLETLSQELIDKGYAVKYADLEQLEIVETPVDINPGWGTAYAGDPMERLNQQLPLDQYADKLLIWLGDGQDLRPFSEKCLGWDMYALIEGRSEDFGIRDLVLPKTGLQVGQGYDIGIELANQSASEMGLVLELMINEERQNQRGIDAGELNIRMASQAREPGFQIGLFQLSGDRFSFNDMRHFVIPAQGRTPFQILRKPSSVDFWSVIKMAMEKQSPNMEIRLLDSEQSDDLDLSRGGTVVVENAALLADYSLIRLQGFVNRGGQLVTFGDGGPLLNTMLGFSVPLRVKQTTSSMVLRITREGRRAGLPEPLSEVIAANRLKIYTRYLTSGGELGTTWIRYDDSEPFLGSSRYGDGQVIWFNTNFEASASNVSLLGVFPALMFHFGQSAISSDMTSHYNYLIGDTLYFQPDLTGESESFSIARPDGTTDFASPDSGYVISYSNTTVPGIYTLNRGRRVLEAMAVNIDPHEAETIQETQLPDETLVFQTSERKSLSQEILTNRTGFPLWPILLILLLITWMLETYVSRIKKNWRTND
jgi:hypothetical protein